MPEEEKSIKTGDRAVHCYHFCMAKDEAKDSAPQLQNFGYPFLLRVCALCHPPPGRVLSIRSAQSPLGTPRSLPEFSRAYQFNVSALRSAD